jgi:hypothetical protein
VLRPQETAHLGVEAFCRLDVDHVTDPRDDHESRTRDLGVKVLRYVQRRTRIFLAVQQQRRHVDALKDVAKICFGKRTRRRPQPGRMELGDVRRDLPDEFRRGRLREQRRDQGAHQLIRRQLGLPKGLLEALIDDLGGKRAGPPRIGRRQHQ